MCGIVGLIASYSNGMTSDEADAFRDMVFLDTLRGWDSTGVFSVKNNGNVTVLKDAKHGPDFIRTPEFKEFKSTLFSRGLFAVGHNRAATKGAVTDKNAHPFVVDDKIVLVQNGTYYGSHKHHKDTEVDTEAVAHVIAEHDDIEEALQKINASYVLVWYDVPNSTLNIIRNEHRPMFIAETSTGGIMFASEMETIMYAAFRNKIKLKGKPEDLKPGILRQYKCDFKAKGGFTFSSEDREVDYKSRFTTENSEEFGWDEYLARRYYGHYMGGNTQQTQMLPGPKNVMQTTRDVIAQYNSDNVSFEKTSGDLILEDNFPQFRLNNMQEQYWHKWLANATSDRTIGVELIDYCPMEDKPGNRSWMLVGRIIHPDDEWGSPLLYQIRRDVSESEVLDATAGKMYLCRKIGAAIAYNVNHSKPNSYKLVAHCITDLVPMEVIENVH